VICMERKYYCDTKPSISSFLAGAGFSWSSPTFRIGNGVLKGLVGLADEGRRFIFRYIFLLGE
jgi:uncharacterized membrane protein